METKTIFLQGENLFNSSRENLKKSIEEQKFLFFSKTLGSFDTLRINETDTHIYWANDRFTPRFNGKLFYTSNGISGISFDKKTRDIKFWYGKRPHTYLIKSFYAYMSCDWYNQLPRSFMEYSTVSLAKDIAKGKIKSIPDYAAHLSKRSLMFKGIDPVVLTKLIHLFRMNHNDSYVSLDFLSSAIKVSTDPSEAVEFICDSENLFSYNLMHTITRAMALGEKIDFSSRTAFEKEVTRITNDYIAQTVEYKIDTDLPF